MMRMFAALMISLNLAACVAGDNDGFDAEDEQAGEAIDMSMPDDASDIATVEGEEEEQEGFDIAELLEKMRVAGQITRVTGTKTTSATLHPGHGPVGRFGPLEQE